MKQQTSLDWFDEQLQSAMQIEYTRKGIRVITIPIDWYIQCKQQAKAMEKEQIMNAYIDGEHQQGFEGEAEQYYNETFKP